MGPQQDIRRHPDGSLDVDFYRRRAAGLRAEAMRELFRARAVPVAKTVIAAAVVAAALSVVPTADGTGWNGPRPNGSLDATLPTGAKVAGRF